MSGPLSVWGMSIHSVMNFHSGYVLHARPYQETSLLLELFTLEQGRISAIAKGAKRPKSKARGLLQPFSPLLLLCVGRGELLTLTQVDAARVPYPLRGRRLISAFYVNELLVRLLNRWDTHPALFLNYQETLSQLAIGACEQKTLRLFEKNLLQALGYGLPLLTRIKIDPEQYYFFDPEQGPIHAENHRLSVNNIHHRSFKGSSLLNLEQDILEDPRTLLDAKNILRQALSVRLGAKPLESRRLLAITG